MQNAPRPFDVRAFARDFVRDPVHKGVLDDLAAYDAGQRGKNT